MHPPTQALSCQADPAILSIADMIGDTVAPARFPDTILRWRNDDAASAIGLNGLGDAQWIAHFGRFAPLPDNLPHPLALRYHGHQFGTYNPDIGDGRGFLFAQFRDGDGRLIDLGTKGSGETPYSRFGDGRLTLKGAVRELLATEMLAALGVDTSRTFSIIETGEALERHDEPSPTRAAVLVRMSHSHIRIGSFQRLAYLGDDAGLERLLRYCLRHYLGRTDADSIPAADAAAALLSHVAVQCGRLAASYMVAGFVHGVLNTDNIAITGESFDYGPWRFTPLWDPDFVAAYFDHGGRYAFGRQPQMIQWNVGQLAIALRQLAPADVLIGALEAYVPAYQAALCERFCWRLGVEQQGEEADLALVRAAERLMTAQTMPVDVFFRTWAGGLHAPAAPSTEESALLAALAGRRSIRGAWWETAAPQSMLIEEVEGIWSAIDTHDDWQPLYAKVQSIRAMGRALASVAA